MIRRYYFYNATDDANNWFCGVIKYKSWFKQPDLAMKKVRSERPLNFNQFHQLK